VQEIPWFIEFQQKYKDQGLTVVGLSQDDDWKPVNDYVAAKKVNYPILLDTKHVGDDYDLSGMPVSVLIDRSGRIASRHVGVVDRDATEAEIKALLTEESSKP
jgi:peroxiredoxin